MLASIQRILAPGAQELFHDQAPIVEQESIATREYREPPQGQKHIEGEQECSVVLVETVANTVESGNLISRHRQVSAIRDGYSLALQLSSNGRKQEQFAVLAAGAIFVHYHHR